MAKSKFSCLFVIIQNDKCFQNFQQVYIHPFQSRTQGFSGKGRASQGSQRSVDTGVAIGDIIQDDYSSVKESIEMTTITTTATEAAEVNLTNVLRNSSPITLQVDSEYFSFPVISSFFLLLVRRKNVLML